MRLLGSSVVLAAVCHSRLSRHVSILLVNDPRLSADHLRLVASRMPHLRQLDCRLALPPRSEALLLPPNLTKLNLTTDETASTEQVNQLLRVASQLPLLREFAVWLKFDLDPRISFAPFHSTPLLTKLKVHSYHETAFSNAQIDEFRAMPHLEIMNLDVIGASTQEAALRRLLRTPHSLQWKSLGQDFELDTKQTALLPLLPSLTHVGGYLTAADPAFLLQLPNMMELKLYLPVLRHIGRGPTTENLLTALRGCSKLTSLFLASCNFNSQHMCALLPCLPALTKLTLFEMRQLESLRCFSRGPVTCTLTELTLFNCRHPELLSTELEHVHALTELRSLTIEGSLAEPLDAAIRQQYSRPDSLLLPKLTKFSYRAN
jgi:hypothetical protein